MPASLKPPEDFPQGVLVVGVYDAAKCFGLSAKAERPTHIIAFAFCNVPAQSRGHPQSTGCRRHLPYGCRRVATGLTGKVDDKNAGEQECRENDPAEHNILLFFG